MNDNDDSVVLTLQQLLASGEDELFNRYCAQVSAAQQTLYAESNGSIDAPLFKKSLLNTEYSCLQFNKQSVFKSLVVNRQDEALFIMARNKLAELFLCKPHSVILACYSYDRR